MGTQKEEKKFAETYGNVFLAMLPMLVMFIGILICAFTGKCSPFCSPPRSC